MEPFRIGNECPVHPIAGNLPWEPSDFHMKRKGLAASCGESIRADWTGRALAVRAARIGGGSWGGVRFRGFVLRSVQRDSAGRIGRLAACAAAGDEVGKPAQTGRLRQALMFGFAEQEIDSGVQRVGDADECGVVGFAALGDVVVHPGSADAYAIREVRLRNVPFIQQLPQTVAEQDVNNVFRFQGDHPLALGRRPLRVSGVRDSDSQ